MKSSAAPSSRSDRATANSRSTSTPVSAAVGSSITTTRASADERLRDLDELLVGDRQAAGRPARVDRHAEPGEELARPGCTIAAPVDGFETTQWLAAHRDVLRDGQVGEQRRLLVDDRDPGRLRVRGTRSARAAHRRARGCRRPGGARRPASSRSWTCRRRSRRPARAPHRRTGRTRRPGRRRRRRTTSIRRGPAAVPPSVTSRSSLKGFKVVGGKYGWPRVGVKRWTPDSSDLAIGFGH